MDLVPLKSAFEVSPLPSDFEARITWFFLPHVHSELPLLLVTF